MTMLRSPRRPLAALTHRVWVPALLAGAVLGLSMTGWLKAQTPGSSAQAGSSDGKAIYEERCARCHGATGKGDGREAGLLLVKPRDFTTGRYKLRSTESGSLPTDGDLTRTITSGMHGTSMPGWQPFLNDTQIAAVSTYIKSFSPRFQSEPPKPVVLGDPPVLSPDSIARGQAVYEKLKCASCHGTDGRGTGAVATDLKDDWGHPTIATSLTEPWTFRGGATARDILLRFRTGMSGTPMPSFKDAATDVEMGHLANYVVSLARKPLWEMSAPEVQTFYTDLGRQEQADKVARGRYLLNTLGCPYCHSPVTDEGAQIEALAFAGGQRLSLYPFTEVVSYNLTADRGTGLGSWTDAQIKQVLTRGVRPDGSRMLPFPMPWTAYANLTPSDLDALVAGLRSLAPISNAIPGPRNLSLVPYLWGKFQVLILKRDIPGTTYPGNAGTPGGVTSWQTLAK